MEDMATAHAEVMQSLKVVSHAIQRRRSREQIAEWLALNITMGQMKTMMALAPYGEDGGLNVTALAEILCVSKPAASILVDQLVQHGLVRRREDPEDRRRTLVALTPTALDMMARLRQENFEPFARWLDALASDDLAALLRGLCALRAVVEREEREEGAVVSAEQKTTRAAVAQR
ncbi:MAG TPA: MarR family transcriptional regulator [Ktedonobacterales bacterium]|nr:MarR family transcriptional regulator [Ktedonobacterales bacterium]